MEVEKIVKLVNETKDSNIERLTYSDHQEKIDIIYNTVKEESVVHQISKEVIGDSVIDEEIVVIKSTMVGTAYLSQEEGGQPFINKGDRVAKGKIICIVEAMKVLNEVKSDVDGCIEEILIKNEEFVEYGQELFKIKI